MSCALPAFGGRAPCCRFDFRKSPAVCLRYQKQKIVFSCRMCSGLVWMQKTHSTLTTLCIRRILILYIYGNFIGSQDKKANRSLGTSHKGKPLFSASKISKVKNSAKTVNINQFEKIHHATIKISNPGGYQKICIIGRKFRNRKKSLSNLENLKGRGVSKYFAYRV